MSIQRSLDAWVLEAWAYTFGSLNGCVGRSANGNRIWFGLGSYPVAYRDATDIEAGANNKGIAIGGGRVIRGTTDGHLIALDIKTGDLLWDKKIMDSSSGASAMAAPVIWHDLVFMGAAGGDLGVRGEVSAYHVSDGTKAWSFSTVPTENETGADSWEKAATASHGGGGVWTYLTLDPKIGTLYLPVGNPGPDFNSKARPGANLFTTGIVALDASSGKLRWWYQTQPNDDHDWNATGS
jgi:glucose dehydrogenase